jgi:hypothetical protein
MIQTNASGATIAGGTFNTIHGGVGLVGPVGPAVVASTISGGTRNTIQTNASGSTIGGGSANTIQPAASGSTIGGGIANTIQGASVIFPPLPVQGLSANSTIGGGYQNTIQTNAPFSTISGGQSNSIQTNAYGSVIGGGSFNTIQGSLGGIFAQLSVNSAIGGGYRNTIHSNALFSIISGGLSNSIQIGAINSTIGGGGYNTNTGNFATVPGGDQNVAGTNSFAAGHRAKATNTGTFVWADSTNADFASTGNNQFLIRASGGVGIGVNNPDAALTVNGDADCFLRRPS